MLQRISLKQESIRIAVRLFCFCLSASNAYGHLGMIKGLVTSSPLREVYQAFIAVLKIIR